MNKVNLIGNLTKNPEVRYTTGEKPMAICKFTVAVNDGFGESKQTSFIPVTVFGKSAENCEKYLLKGSKVAVSGKIQTGSYEKDGIKHYTTDVIADNFGGIEFLAKGEATSGTTEHAESNFSQLMEDDIPF